MGKSIPQQVDAPGFGAIAVTPNDSTDLAKACRALYIGTTGDVKVNTWDASTVTFKTVPVGILPIACTRVWSTGTTAAEIIGLY